jgi:hypothetical protein
MGRTLRRLARRCHGGLARWALAALAAGTASLWPLAGGAQGAAEGPSLQIARRVITILGADEQRQALEVLERVDLRNPGDAPFVPDLTGAAGPMGVLRFALPRGAYDLALDDRLGSAETLPVDRGFGSLLAVPPGTTDVTFAYRVPYTGHEFALDTGVVYPTDSVLVLVPRPLEACSPQLTPRETVPIGQREYQVLVGERLAAGQRLVVTLAGLPYTPRPWLLDAPVQRALAAGLAAASVGAVVAYGLWRRRTAALDAACWQ